MKNLLPRSSTRVTQPISLQVFFSFLAFFILLLSSCSHNGKGPDTSGVDVKEIHIERFDTAFFSLDSNNVVPGLYRLSKQYPYFMADFVGNILGAGPLSDTSH